MSSIPRSSQDSIISLDSSYLRGERKTIFTEKMLPEEHRFWHPKDLSSYFNSFLSFLAENNKVYSLELLEGCFGLDLI